MNCIIPKKTEFLFTFFLARLDIDSVIVSNKPMKNLLQKIKPFIVFVLLGILSNPLSAQISPGSLGYYQDAFRFSQTQTAGTARFQGLGGAQTSLGGDLGSVNGNPAGLGFFRKSEFSFSPGVTIAHASTEYYDLSESPISVTEDSKVNPNLNQFGIALYLGKDDLEGGKWRGGTFAVSLARTNNFQNRFSYKGDNFSSSKTDYFVDITDGIRVSELENLDFTDIELQRAAYFAFLINPFEKELGPEGELIDIPDPEFYYTEARDPSGNLLAPIIQEETINTLGAQYQWSFSYGGNYDDKLYLGANLGVSTVNYRQENDYKETINNPNSFLDSFDQSDILKVRGTGVNLSLGFIYRPIDFFRIGASFTSPTWYSLREEFSTAITSRIYNENNVLDIFNEQTLPGEFNYTLRSPWRANIGASFFVGKYGFISADAEYVAYNTMKLSSLEFDGVFDADNQTIRTIYEPTWNYKLGAEFRKGIFRLRGGVNLQNDPYDNLDDIDRKILSISGGLGVRLSSWYADVAVTRASSNSAYLPYSFDSNSIYAGLEPVTQSKNKLLNVVFTTGFYFGY